MSVMATSVRRTSSHAAMLVFVVAIATLAFLATPNGPLGFFWRPDPSFPIPTPEQQPFFVALNVFQSIGFALGIALVTFGWHRLKPIGEASLRCVRLAFISTAWLIGNWWIHDSLHVANGHTMDGLLIIEYGFHLTLMIGGLLIARFMYLSSRPAPL